MMQLDIAGWLSRFFTTVLYPAVVIAVFASIFLMLAIIVGKANDLQGGLRRLTGALLPLVALVLVMATHGPPAASPKSAFEALHPSLQFAIGAALGIILMESAKFFLETDSDGAAGAYAVFVASLGGFMLWSVMGGVLQNLNLALLGLVLGGGLHVVFRGLPDF